MNFMTLQPIDYVNGISSIIYALIMTIVAIKIFLKYFKTKNNIFLFVGIAAIGLAEPWYPSSLSFLWNLIFQAGITFESYVIIGNVLIPLMLLLWVWGFTNMAYPEKKKVVGIIYACIGIAFEIAFFTFLVIDPKILGEFNTASMIVRIDIEYKGFMLGYLLFIVANILITFILFGRLSLNQMEPELRIKGKFLILAPIFWSVGAVLDTASALNPYILIITRIILVFSAFLFYFGFILPSRIKNLLIKK